MSEPAKSPVPAGMHTLTPHLTCNDAAAAIDFYRRAWGAEELMRMPGPNGKIMHAQIRIGNSIVMLNDEVPEWGALGPLALKGTPVSLQLMVPDVDAVFGQAVAAGATVVMPVSDMFWGDRYGVVLDPFGHKWAVATRVVDMSAEEMLAAGAKWASQQAGQA